MLTSVNRWTRRAVNYLIHPDDEAVTANRAHGRDGPNSKSQDQKRNNLVSPSNWASRLVNLPQMLSHVSSQTDSAEDWLNGAGSQQFAMEDIPRTAYLIRNL
jgi:hypothetical protein